MSTMHSTLTPERVRQLLNYDAETGIFTRIANIRNQVRAGNIAGSKNNSGHLAITIDGTSYLAHRLAWFYMTGQWPEKDIDHINCIKTDNRFSNLRDVPRAINNENRRTSAPRSKLWTGLIGVTSDHGRNFRARICVNGKHIHLGTFKDPNDAYQAYLEAKRKLHIGCTI